MLQATSRNKRTEHEEPRCAALQLARRIPPAFSTTGETLVDEAEGRKTIKQFGVRVFVIQKTCNLQTILLSLGTGLHVSEDSSVKCMVRV